ncbi:origin recognition complex subunit 5 C-terminus-domain-containing protein, partial [Fomitopsis serialis]|uniref:origin recognition complex subunit 5 C-terminus-domain-containing protein n=1 Tax=Fomitopsis serialis TaxID=139415 RepID=UPI0020074BD2
HPGYEDVTTQLATLLATSPLHFIHVYDPECARIASECLRGLLEHLSEEIPCFRYAFANAVACFTPRLFYDTVINALARHTPTWEDGCENWAGPSGEGQRWNESIDTFLHGLRAVSKHEQQWGRERCRMVLVVERPERLKENTPELLVPLTRLAELSRVDIVTIFVSDVRWEDLRSPLGASPEPLHISVPVLSNKVSPQTVSDACIILPSGQFNSRKLERRSRRLQPRLPALYTHFIATVHSICGPFTHDPNELAYIAAARWPGFIQPVLDEHRQRLREYEEYLANRGDYDEGDEEMGPPELVAPTEDTRLRLLRLFTPSLTAALEALYPRLTNAADWARTHAPPPDLLALHPSQVPHAFRSAALGNADGMIGRGVDDLPRMAKFVLVAAFLASTNPPKSDVRMFGRGLDDRKRRRRKGGGPRKGRPGTATKASHGITILIPQRLLGPLTFTLDRLVAILGVLLEENDAETRPPAPQYTVPGEYTDVEISRVAIFAQVIELSSMRLLMRTSPSEKIDSPATFKCGVSYDTALKLAKDVGVPLNSLIWE